MSFGAVLRELQPQAKVIQLEFWFYNCVELYFLFPMMPLSCCLVQFWGTTAHMGSPKVIQLRFWLCNLVELSFLFPMMPLSCCLVQFWQSYSLHRESSHAMGNKDMGRGIQKIWQGTTCFRNACNSRWSVYLAPGLIGKTVNSDRMWSVPVGTSKAPAEEREGERDSSSAKLIVRLTPPLGCGSSMGSPDYPARENQIHCQCA